MDTREMTTPVPAGFAWTQGPAGRALVSTRLQGVTEHLFTTRDLAFRGDRLADDFERLGAALDCTGASVARVRQVHGAVVHIVRPGVPCRDVPDADAIISLDPGRPVSVRIADCVPIL